MENSCDNNLMVKIPTGFGENSCDNNMVVKIQTGFRWLKNKQTKKLDFGGTQDGKETKNRLSLSIKL